ncbi:agamous-like MADS-box protein MADS9 isoform X2 [Syzygium oleosum]|uniref:agamous-like MADS-box protein MADS9 isoform X2 n=1 Tax=Syzygium oleosum TaxID=219896 RepID=UPI0011D19B47|nr:agamous-like MADS-box protein MADS9 isoform X2 [Syzygium oleosum]
MGRGKIEIKRIENANNRQVTYSKRRNGLIKKAKEISVLCNAKVSVIIFGGSKKVHEYCTPSAKMTDILDEYHRQCGKRLWDAKHENLNSEIDRIKKENDNLQIKLRHLNGQDINSLNHKELIVLEDVLENGLDFVRDHKMEFINTHRRNHKMLEEQNKELNYYVQPLQLNLQERI